LTGGGTKTFTGAVVTNAGRINLAGTTPLAIDGTTLNNNGTFDIQAAVDVQGRGAGPTFDNAGVLMKTGGGVSTLGTGAALNLVNGGTIRVDAGTLAIANNSFPTNDGRLQLATGTTFSTGGNNLTNAAGSSLRGTGTLNVGTATFTNGGTVAPGASPGTLLIVGNFTQSPAGTLDVELGGLTRGVTYDLFDVTGTANLAGTLRVTNVNGFLPTNGNVFDVMNFANSTGNFSTFDLPAASTFNTLVGPTFYRLTSTGSGFDAGNLIKSENDRMVGGLPEENVDHEVRPPFSNNQCS
jgi:hypothetical protein